MKRPPSVRSKPMIRVAQTADLPVLEELERTSFATDRLSRRSFAHALRNPQAYLAVATDAGKQVQGYALVFFRRGSARARLYSIAVAAAARGNGLGRALLTAAEKTAKTRGCGMMTLEVRAADPVAQALYRAAGYQEFGRYPGYYEDGAEALRLVKPLSAALVAAMGAPLAAASAPAPQPAAKPAAGRTTASVRVRPRPTHRSR